MVPTGGVGSIADQLAAAFGATVIATAKSGEEAELVRSLARMGSSATGDVPAQVRRLGAGVHQT